MKQTYFLTKVLSFIALKRFNEIIITENLIFIIVRETYHSESITVK